MEELSPVHNIEPTGSIQVIKMLFAHRHIYATDNMTEDNYRAIARGFLEAYNSLHIKKLDKALLPYIK